MATERIRIIVTEDGSRAVARNFDRVGDSARRLQGQINFVRRAFVALGLAFTVRQFIELSDTYTNITNRLRLVTTGTRELADVQAQLAQAAIDTRVGYQGTATLYARAALSLRTLGTSQEEVLNLTRSVNQAIILSGVTGREANAGLIQFSQGLSSGALRGDELRSVLEQLPLVADVIARELGVTRGELRKMGEDGTITAEVILRAFRNAREELAGRFAETVPTIAQAFEVFRTNLTLIVADMNNAVGINRLFSETLLFVGENLDTISTILTTIVAIGIARYLGIAATAFIAWGRATLFAAQQALVAQAVLGGLTLRMQAATLAAQGFSAALSLVGGVPGLLILVASAAFLYRREIIALLNPMSELQRETQEYAEVLETLRGTGLSARSGTQILAEQTLTAIERARELASSIDTVRTALQDLGSQSEQQLNNVLRQAETIETSSQVEFAVAEQQRQNLLREREEIVRRIAQIESLPAGPSGGLLGSGVAEQLRSLRGEITSIDEALQVQAGLITQYGAAWRDAADNVKLVEQALEDVRARNAARDNAQFLQEFAGMIASLNGIADAQQRIAEITALADRAVNYNNGGPGSITSEQRNAIIARANELLYDQLHPMEALTASLRQEIDLLGLESQERTVQEELLRVRNDLTRAGVDLNSEYAQSQYAIIEGLIREREALSELNGLTREQAIQQHLDGLTREMEFLTLSNREREIRNRLDDVQRDLRERGIQLNETELAQFREGIGLLIDRRAEVQNFQDLFQSVWKNIGSALDSAIDNWKLNFKELARSILSDLAKILLRILLMRALMTAFGGPAQAGGSLASFAKGGSGGFASLAGGLGFQTGGQFQVGGTGGPDSQVVAFRATPNETVTVETPAQRAARLNGSMGGATTITINNTFQGNLGSEDDREQFTRDLEAQVRSIVAEERRLNPSFLE